MLVRRELLLGSLCLLRSCRFASDHWCCGYRRGSCRCRCRRSFQCSTLRLQRIDLSVELVLALGELRNASAQFGNGVGCLGDRCLLWSGLHSRLCSLFNFSGSRYFLGSLCSLGGHIFRSCHFQISLSCCELTRMFLVGSYCRNISSALHSQLLRLVHALTRSLRRCRPLRSRSNSTWVKPTPTLQRVMNDCSISSRSSRPVPEHWSSRISQRRSYPGLRWSHPRISSARTPPD